VVKSYDIKLHLIMNITFTDITTRSWRTANQLIHEELGPAPVAPPAPPSALAVLSHSPPSRDTDQPKVSTVNTLPRIPENQSLSQTEEICSKSASNSSEKVISELETTAPRVESHLNKSSTASSRAPVHDTATVSFDAAKVSSHNISRRTNVTQKCSDTNNKTFNRVGSAEKVSNSRRRSEETCNRITVGQVTTSKEHKNLSRGALHTIPNVSSRGTERLNESNDPEISFVNQSVSLGRSSSGSALKSTTHLYDVTAEEGSRGVGGGQSTEGKRPISSPQANQKRMKPTPQRM